MTDHAPLTPRECNLQDFPFMPLEVKRLLNSETWGLGSGDDRAAAMTLWLQSWHQVPAGSLPARDEMLAHLAGMPTKWKKVKAHALRGWVLCTDGRLYHPEIAPLVLRAWAAKQARMRKVSRRLEIESGEWAEIRQAVFERDDYTCRYCGVRGVRLEADHVIPVARGGETSMENLATACFPCNRSKDSKLLEEWRRP